MRIFLFFFALHTLALASLGEKGYDAFCDFNQWSMLQTGARLSEDQQSMLQAGDGQLMSNGAAQQNGSPQTMSAAAPMPAAPSTSSSTTTATTTSSSSSSSNLSLSERLAALDAAHPDEAESRIASEIVNSINAAEQEGARKITDQLEPKLVEKENRVKELEAQLKLNSSGKSGSEVRVKGYWTQDGLHLVLFASLVASYVV